MNLLNIVGGGDQKLSVRTWVFKKYVGALPEIGSIL